MWLSSPAFLDDHVVQQVGVIRMLVVCVYVCVCLCVISSLCWRMRYLAAGDRVVELVCIFE